MRQKVKALYRLVKVSPFRIRQNASRRSPGARPMRRSRRRFSILHLAGLPQEWWR